MSSPKGGLLFKTQAEALRALQECKGANWTVEQHATHCGYWRIVRARDQELFPLNDFRAKGGRLTGEQELCLIRTTYNLK